MGYRWPPKRRLGRGRRVQHPRAEQLNRAEFRQRVADVGDELGVFLRDIPVNRFAGRSWPRLGGGPLGRGRAALFLRIGTMGWGEYAFVLMEEMRRDLLAVGEQLARVRTAPSGTVLDEIDITLCTGHFHDVAISKEGAYGETPPLLHVEWRGAAVPFTNEDLNACAIPTLVARSEKRTESRQPQHGARAPGPNRRNSLTL
jgi:hypothetical protein